MKYEETKVNNERWLNINDLENEIWKDIKDYEGLYQVSNYGRVKSLEKVVIKTYRGNRNHKARILKQSNVKGYLYVKLQKNKQKKNFGVHRLVAEAFIPNPDNYNEIDHIKPITNDECNNCVCNLRWCNHKQNMLDNIETYKNIRAKKVNCYDLDWNYIKTYESILSASKDLKLSEVNIRRCCNGHKHHKRVGKYRFQLIKEVG